MVYLEDYAHTLRIIVSECGLLPMSITHFIHSYLNWHTVVEYFIDIETITPLPQYQWSNP